VLPNPPWRSDPAFRSGRGVNQRFDSRRVADRTVLLMDVRNVFGSAEEIHPHEEIAPIANRFPFCRSTRQANFEILQPPRCRREKNPDICPAHESRRSEKEWQPFPDSTVPAPEKKKTTRLWPGSWRSLRRLPSPCNTQVVVTPSIAPGRSDTTTTPPVVFPLGSGTFWTRRGTPTLSTYPGLIPAPTGMALCA